MAKKRSAEPTRQSAAAPSAPPDEYQNGAAADSSRSQVPSQNAAAPVTVPDATMSTPVISPNSSPPPTYGTTSAMYPQIDGSTNANAYSPQMNNLGPDAAAVAAANSSAAADGADVPPPPYAEALHCPAPPYLPYGSPKPPYMQQQPGQQPIYPTPISGTGYVLQAPGQSNSDATHHGAPPPHVIHVTSGAALPPTGNTCVHCYSGEVHNETDLCCLLCLILFAIFTFPMGLVLLCCVPCVVRKRCIRCRRLN